MNTLCLQHSVSFIALRMKQSSLKSGWKPADEAPGITCLLTRYSFYDYKKNNMGLGKMKYNALFTCISVNDKPLKDGSFHQN